MNRIKILPQVLANKIAAGEVVERPASVVKELIENSIDAGAARIEVEAVAGGKQLIRVRDDGCGMSPDDAILAFEHHATSKIFSAEDLASITTLGFRGEALPSIASISWLFLRTVEPGDGPRAGTEVEVRGGIMRQVRETAWERGTEVEVRQLFFNVPARRKFLKSVETELGHITRLVTHYGLARPEISFSFSHQGRELINCPKAESVAERAAQVFGSDFMRNLVEFAAAWRDVSVYGFASRPHEQRSTPYSQFFYVNKRMVRDRIISHAVAQAYRAVIPSGVYPVVLLFIELPPSEVDVNVHPQKLEIRFRDQETVHGLIQGAIEQALLRARSVPNYAQRPAREPEPYTLSAAPVLPQGDLEFAPPPAERCDTAPAQIGPHEAGGDEYYSVPLSFAAGGLRPLGQLRDSFIVAADSQGLLIVDQHVAHERVLFEKVLAEMEGQGVLAQQLLVPEVFDLTPEQEVLLGDLFDELRRSGFELERFGGRTVAIRAVPAMAREVEARLLLTEILQGLEREQRTRDISAIRRRIAAGVACRAAIKINHPLTDEKMQWLLDELARARVPTHCPHGRPIALRLSLREIEKNFKRP